MAKYKVHMIAYGKPGEIREVEVPENEVACTVNGALESIFHYGQNDFQPQQHPSVSMGDVAEIDGKFYLCEVMGWGELSPKELEEYRALDAYGRMDYLWKGKEE